MLGRLFAKRSSNLARSLINTALPDSLLNGSEFQESTTFDALIAKMNSNCSATSLLIRNLNFARSYVPANQSIGCLGRIDYFKNMADGSSVVRGWIFHKKFLISDLFVSTEALTVRSYAHRLERWDVADIFGITTARTSGFMAYFQPRSYNTAFDGKINFRAILSDGTAREGALQLFSE
jgi:hypothetical protein